MTAPCKFHSKSSRPACGKPGRAVIVGCVHEHIYESVLCPDHEDASHRRCAGCWELPKPDRHACELLVTRLEDAR